MSDITVSKPDFERLYISRAEYNALRAELAQAKAEIARLQGIIDLLCDSESQYPYRYAIRPAEDALTAYTDKLAAGLPEGMLPKDVEVLREANAKLAQEVHELREANRWIPCAERLPDEGDSVFVFPVKKVCFLHEDCWYIAGPIPRVLQSMVTHWMPLPAGPEVEA